MGILNSHNGTLTQFDDVVIRKIIEYIKVISSNKIQIVFKGGVEVVGGGVIIYWDITRGNTRTKNINNNQGYPLKIINITS